MITKKKLIEQREIPLPKLYNSATVDLVVIKSAGRKLDTEQKDHNMSIEQMCPSLGAKLINLIPPSESVLRKILRTEVVTENSKPFLECLLSKGFDKENLSLRQEFSWDIFTMAAPFMVDTAHLYKMFESLNTFWVKHAQISFKRDEPRYYFTFKWL